MKDNLLAQMPDAQQLLNEAATQTSVWAPKLLGVLVIIALFFIAAKVLKRVIRLASQRFDLDPNIASLFLRTGNITLIVFGVVTALGTLGINVSALVAGLGLTGFALGFALKDTISNFLSGVLILLYRPFSIGDRIRIAGYEGDVISIDLRYTELNAGDHKVLIPNSKLFTEPITVLG